MPRSRISFSVRMRKRRTDSEKPEYSAPPSKRGQAARPLPRPLTAGSTPSVRRLSTSRSSSSLWTVERSEASTSAAATHKNVPVSTPRLIAAR